MRRRSRDAVAIIQSRMGSTRLPGKALELVGDRPMLERVIERTAMASRVDGVVVATTALEEDQSIAELCKTLDAGQGVPCLRSGRATNDVLGRYLDVAERLSLRTIVRITGDCPLIDPAVIDRVIDAYERGADYCSNIWPRTYPDGLDVEVFSIATLRKLDRLAVGVDREHVTSLVLARPREFGVIRNATNNVDLSALRWTVDTPEDLEFVREVYHRLSPRRFFGMNDVLALGDYALRTAA